MLAQGDLVMAWVDCNNRIEQQLLWLLVRLRVDTVGLLGSDRCNFGDVERLVRATAGALIRIHDGHL